MESPTLDLSDPHTAQHLLSLPSHLLSLSPSLAALHLARIRLLTSLALSGSASTSTSTAIDNSLRSLINGEVTGWWCSTCGALREGLSGVYWDHKTRLKKKREEEQKFIDSKMEEDVDGTRFDSSRCNTVLRQENVKKKRKMEECQICGNSFKKIKPDLSAKNGFLPARTIRLRNVKQNQDQSQSRQTQVKEKELSDRKEVVEGNNSIKENFGSKKMGNVKDTNMDWVSDFPMTQAVDSSLSHLGPLTSSSRSSTRQAPLIISAQPAASADDLDVEPTQNGEVRKNGKAGKSSSPLSSPRLKYIPSTSPHPPTYPEPPPATQNRIASTSGNSVKPGSGSARKKKKSSGLAKLLAQSKEREEASKASKDNWGFG